MQIHEKYIVLAKEVYKMVEKNVEVPKVLKTDCFNEGANYAPIANLFEDAYCVDVDNELVNKAKKAFPDLKCFVGDIRELPFDDEIFDVVIDCSTIDHVPDFEKVIIEYNRVLRKDGICLICTWVSLEKLTEDTKKWNKENQYFHYLYDFVNYLQFHFKILKEGEIYTDRKCDVKTDNFGKNMYYFILKKGGYKKNGVGVFRNKKI